MKSKITKRDIRIFFLGILSMILLNLVLNWEENINDFKDGLQGAHYDAPADSNKSK